MDSGNGRAAVKLLLEGAGLDVSNDELEFFERYYSAIREQAEALWRQRLGGELRTLSEPCCGLGVE